jgi:hypothetical protein
VIEARLGGAHAGGMVSLLQSHIDALKRIQATDSGGRVYSGNLETLGKVMPQ